MARVKSEIAYPIDLPWYPSISNETPGSFCQEFTNLLTTGTVTTNANGAQCCPECGIYAIANAAIMANFLRNVDSELLTGCCYSIHASAEAYAEFKKDTEELFTVLQMTTCSTNLLECVNGVKSSLGKACCDTLETIGVVEIGGLNPDPSQSQLCTLLSYLKSIQPALTPDQMCSCLTSILTYGIVVQCLPNGQIFVGGVDAFLDYMNTK